MTLLKPLAVGRSMGNVGILWSAVLLCGATGGCSVSDPATTVDSKHKRDATAVPTPKAWRRWAILSDDSAAGDLLTVALSQRDDLELVERDRLAAVADEQRLAARQTSGDGRAQVTLGRILAADALIVLSLRKGTVQQEIDAPADSSEPRMQVVICECQFGARLHFGSIPWNEGDLESRVAQIVSQFSETIARFPNGVEQVVGVAPFVSRNLEHDHDVWQDGFAELLGAAVFAQPGVALIEAEAANWIEQEMQGDDALRRFTPAVVSGDYRVERASEALNVSMTATVRRGDAPPREFSLPSCPLPEAVAWLTRELPAQISSKRSSSPSLSSEAQFRWLVERADAFRSLGDFAHETHLREAAVLLKPDDAVQRKALTVSYFALAGALRKKLPPTFLSDPNAVDRFRQVCDAFINGLNSEETTIRRGMFRGFFTHSQGTLRGFWTYTTELRRLKQPIAPEIQREFDRVDAARVRFFREATPLAKQLVDPINPPHPDGVEAARDSWNMEMLRTACAICPPKLPSALELDCIVFAWSHLMFDELCGVGLDHLVDKATSTPPRVAFTVQELEHCLARVAALPKKSAQIWARTAQLQLKWARRTPQTSPETFAALHAEARALLDEAERFQGEGDHPRRKPQHGERDPIHFRLEALRHVCVHFREAAAKVEAGVALKQGPLPMKPLPNPPITTGSMYAVDILVNPVRAQVLWLDELQRRRFRAAAVGQSDAAAESGLTACGDALEVLWFSGGLFAMYDVNTIEVWSVEGDPWFTDVAWDGKSIWVATRRDGVWQLDPRGNRIRKFGKAAGLPPVDHALVLHALGPDRVLASGSFGDPERAWLGLIDATNGPTFRMIQESAKSYNKPAQTDEKTLLESRLDVELSYRPLKFFHHAAAGPSSGRILLSRITNRNRATKLLSDWLSIDPRTTSVEVLPDVETIPSVMSQARGILYYAGGATTEPPYFNHTQSGYLKPSVLFASNGRIFLPNNPPSSQWWAFEPKTRQLTSLRTESQMGFTPEFFGRSIHHGVVGWNSKLAVMKYALPSLNVPTADSKRHRPIPPDELAQLRNKILPLSQERIAEVKAAAFAQLAVPPRIPLDAVVVYQASDASLDGWLPMLSHPHYGVETLNRLPRDSYTKYTLVDGLIVERESLPAARVNQRVWHNERGAPVLSASYTSNGLAGFNCAEYDHRGVLERLYRFGPEELREVRVYESDQRYERRSVWCYDAKGRLTRQEIALEKGKCESYDLVQGVIRISSGSTHSILRNTTFGFKPSFPIPSTP